MRGRHLISAGLWIGGGMMLGRLLGFLREVLLASRYGAGELADFSVILMIIPDFVAAALIGGASGGVLIPAFAARDKNSQRLLLWQASLGSVLVAFSMAVVLMLVALPILSVGQGGAWALMLLALPASFLTAVWAAFLQHERRLAAPAFSNVSFNLALMALLWALEPSALAAAMGIVMGSLLRLACHALALARAGVGRPQVLSGRRQWDARMLKDYAAASGTGLLTMLPHYAPYAVLGVASGIAVFNYAFKLVWLPAMLGYMGITMLLLPLLSRRWQHGREVFAADGGMMHFALRLGSLAMVLGLCACGSAVVALVYGRGAMTPDAQAHVEQGFTQGIWLVMPMLLSYSWQQTCFAQGETRLPLRVSFWQCVTVLPACAVAVALWGMVGAFYALTAMYAATCLVFPRLIAAQGLVLLAMPKSGLPLVVLTCVFSVQWAIFSRFSLAPMSEVALYGLAALVSAMAGLSVSAAFRQWIVVCFR